ncbi:hypothetical protein D1007_11715 [Hordeum vulgare]|nr:hypothetical protein D1007_11715 [Hordeum vulgare]
MSISFFLSLLLFPPCCICCSRHLLLHGDANPSSSPAGTRRRRHRRPQARFGYASTPDDADGQLVVRLYQSTLGLPVTGRLDGQPRWARAPGHFLLTYAVLSDVPPYQPLPLRRRAVRAAFRRASSRCGSARRATTTRPTCAWASSRATTATASPSTALSACSATPSPRPAASSTSTPPSGGPSSATMTTA